MQQNYNYYDCDDIPLDDKADLVQFMEPKLIKSVIKKCQDNSKYHADLKQYQTNQTCSFQSTQYALYQNLEDQVKLNMPDSIKFSQLQSNGVHEVEEQSLTIMNDLCVVIAVISETQAVMDVFNTQIQHPMVDAALNRLVLSLNYSNDTHFKLQSSTNNMKLLQEDKAFIRQLYQKWIKMRTYDRRTLQALDDFQRNTLSDNVSFHQQLVYIQHPNMEVLYSTLNDLNAINLMGNIIIPSLDDIIQYSQLQYQSALETVYKNFYGQQIVEQINQLKKLNIKKECIVTIVDTFISLLKMTIIDHTTYSQLHLSDHNDNEIIQALKQFRNDKLELLSISKVIDYWILHMSGHLIVSMIQLSLIDKYILGLLISQLQKY